MEKPLTIALVAGELSGDNLGAPLMRALRQRYPHVQFVGIGGPSMIQEGLVCWTDLDDLSVNGFVEPLKRLPSLLKILFNTRDNIVAAQVDCFIGIDFNFFNGLLEGMVKRRGVKTAHYVSPTIWAWRKGRIRTIKKHIDLMLTLYPFENAIYAENDIKSVFVGHPRADEIALDAGALGRLGARQQLEIETGATVIALLPGSRASEISFSGPDFLNAAQLIQRQLGPVLFLLPAANERRAVQLAALLEVHGNNLDVKILQGQAETAMLAADAVVVNSGTATLEALLLRRPMVMSYRLGALTYGLVSRLVTTPFFALPNILAGRAIIKELIQDEATPEALCAALLEAMEPARHAEIFVEYEQIHRALRRNAGEQAAMAILALCGHAHESKNEIESLRQDRPR
ncbi:MAG: lipid-A-disaccharide synthase [Candidatus Azotimanducaceae bacterium]|jgi:lipid-A-disaccharide synthase